MSEPKKPAGKPIADVAHPGKSAPSASSRPVIVTNRPILKDPMMVDEDAKTTLAEASTPKDEATEKSSSSGLTKLKIQPPATPAAQPAEEPKSEPEKDTAAGPEPDEIAAETKQAEPAPASADDAEKPQVDTTAPDPTAEIEAEAKKQAEHDNAIQKLADSKQYFLPINSVEKRRSKRFVALGIVVSLILVAAWADIALDAGLIHLQGIKPATHFFSN